MKIMFSCIYFPIWPYPLKIMREKKYFIPANCMGWQVWTWNKSTRAISPNQICYSCVYKQKRKNNNKQTSNIFSFYWKIYNEVTRLEMYKNRNGHKAMSILDKQITCNIHKICFSNKIDLICSWNQSPFQHLHAEKGWQQHAKSKTHVTTETAEQISPCFCLLNHHHHHYHHQFFLARACVCACVCEVSLIKVT